MKRQIVIYTLAIVIFQFMIERAYSQNYFEKALSSSAVEQQLNLFFKNILKQYPERDYMELIKATKTNLEQRGLTPEERTDEVYYRELLQALPKIKKTSLKVQVESLRSQQKELKKQTIRALRNEGIKKINGYVEIGSTGKMSSFIRSEIPIQGKIYVLNDEKPNLFSLKDIVTRTGGSFLSYMRMFWPHDFVNLNDYDEIPSDKIPDESIELVTIYIGLHHVSPEKLDSFIKSVHRILKPGGVFIVRDHNATEENQPIVNLAHTTFNAAFGVSQEEENNEIRNFQPLQYWTNAVEKAGLVRKGNLSYRKGDPTQNALMTFVKMDPKRIEDLTDALEIRNAVGKIVNDYHRDGSQSYLTIPEWYLVDTFKEFGKFMEHTPWFNFPFSEYKNGYWKLFESVKGEAKAHSQDPLVYDDYKNMDDQLGYALYALFTQMQMAADSLKFFTGVDKLELPVSISLLVKGSAEEIESIDERIKVEQSFDNGLVLITLPKHLLFTEIIKKMSEYDVRIEEIADQKSIAVAVRHPVGVQLPASSPLKVVTSYQFPTQMEWQETIVSCHVTDLMDIVRMFDDLEGFNLRHIYDY